MSEEQEAILALQTTNAALLASVNVTKANFQEAIDTAVEAAENEAVLALIKMSENSVKTQTLFLTYINQ
jgi:hypothetical protein|tara:strand:- start:1045 stop:1251 length:207 start_codon:yes stop_codon:yes gene_type:complete